MKNEIIAELMFDSDIKVEKMFHLASMLNFFLERLPDDLEDAFAEDYEEIFSEMKIEAPDGFSAEAIFETICAARKFGFLVEIRTPLLKPSGKRSFSCSSNCCKSKWFYRETLEEIYIAAENWVAQYREEAFRELEGA